MQEVEKWDRFEQQELTQSKEAATCLGNCKQFGTTGVPCAVMAAKKSQAQVWLPTPRTCEPLGVRGREPCEWTSALTAAWQMELTKMEVGHVRSY